MSLKPLTENKVRNIVRNVTAACKDINKLNNTGYQYLYLASGFIAHYNLYGFIDYYSEWDLAEDIRLNERANMWNNFREGDENYEYYKQKAEIYRKILEEINGRGN